MDSEDEGELYVGCAGGLDANISMKFIETHVSADMVAYKLSVTGLKGGHSGLDINLGRANSIKLLFRFFYSAEKKVDLKISSIDGGSLRNAIPREAFATVVVSKSKASEFEKLFNEYLSIYKAEFSLTEPGLTFKFENTGLPKSTIDSQTQSKIIRAIFACPNGVIRMSDSMPGLVETSTNLARVYTENSSVITQCLLRSSVDTSKDALADKIASVFELANAEIVFKGGYPGWKPNPDSAILKVMSDVYSKRFGKVPDVKAIHAGLECGILGGAYPKWDMISCGPTIRFPHSPDEKVNIETVNKFWIYIIEVLKNIPIR
jgi:dipeptidase D